MVKIGDKMSILEIKNLSFEYNKDLQALKDVSLSVEKGEFVCILGHNGSGKSTLAKLIMGLRVAKSGEIYVEDQLLCKDNIDDIRQKLGIVFQNPDNQFVGITVKDDIAFGLENRNTNRDEMLNKIDYYSKLIGVDHLLSRDPSSLSGGEKQKVAIASVMACEPEIIIFDESTSMLDPKNAKELLSVIKNLKGTKTIIYITHNLEEALIADRVVVMNKGSIVLSGSPLDVFKEKDIIMDAGLNVIGNLKLINMLENTNVNMKKEVTDFLWELTYQK